MVAFVAWEAMASPAMPLTGAAMATTVVTLELRRPAAAPRQSATPGSASIRASCADRQRTNAKNCCASVTRRLLTA
uniref:Alternative protein PLA2G10 n=1 Tax=Homo sapiens TaxID=9606 RepID=L8E7V2_HUMAN|nr:alternative protein PLA2G10 [Homo sapiens]